MNELPNPGVSGIASIEDPYTLWVLVNTSGPHGALVKVGQIHDCDLVLRVMPIPVHPIKPPERYQVYLDLRTPEGEWRRLHRSEISAPTVAGFEPTIDKRE
jgi:hypothetical protein